MPEISIEEATLLLLILSIVTLMLGVIIRRAPRATKDFVLLMQVFLIGWFSTDLLSSFASQEIQSTISLSYMLVLVGFVLLLVRRWRWAAKEARSLRG
ncbi:MAG: hypothetical protein OK474_06900 [Thaumarchaeota archaeon]|nr:hypothetical protein [Nitrososphaerota archaeon]